MSRFRENFRGWQRTRFPPIALKLEPCQRGGGDAISWREKDSGFERLEIEGDATILDSDPRVVPNRDRPAGNLVGVQHDVSLERDRRTLVPSSPDIVKAVIAQVVAQEDIFVLRLPSRGHRRDLLPLQHLRKQVRQCRGPIHLGGVAGASFVVGGRVEAVGNHMPCELATDLHDRSSTDFPHACGDGSVIPEQEGLGVGTHLFKGQPVGGHLRPVARKHILVGGCPQRAGLRGISILIQWIDMSHPEAGELGDRPAIRFGRAVASGLRKRHKRPAFAYIFFNRRQRGRIKNRGVRINNHLVVGGVAIPKGGLGHSVGFIAASETGADIPIPVA